LKVGRQKEGVRRLVSEAGKIGGKRPEAGKIGGKRPEAGKIGGKRPEAGKRSEGSPYPPTSQIGCANLYASWV
jgi:hypothetical protein